jgi:hypothetical protein
MQEKGSKWGCKVVIPHERKSELDIVVFLPDELLAPNESEAKELGSLAALHRVAGELPSPTSNNLLMRRAHLPCATLPFTLLLPTPC